jgi:predicted secreted protein
MYRLLFALLLAPLGVQAQAPEPLFNLVTFNAQAEREIPNDLLTAILAVESEGTDPAKLAEGTNRSMQAALGIARGYRSVQSRSGNYQTNARYVDQKVSGWRVRQELRLESADFAAVTELIGKLQSSLIVSSITLSVSADARRRTENALIAEAMAAFDERARIVRDAAKEKSFRVRNLQISSSAPVYPQPFASAAPRPAAIASSAPAPAIEAGTSRILITVSGTIQLQ